jgi:ABC-type nickel/cobalt efflux system permease component RcnA
VNDVVFITLIATGFAVGFLHAVIPTHWLPFVVAARAQHWNNAKTLTITGFAGAGHTLFTTALGVVVVWGGIAINSRIGRAFPFLAGGALIALGLFYFIRQIKGGHAHVHLFGSHAHHHEHDHDHAHEHSPGEEHHHHHGAESVEEEEHAIEQDWSRQRSDWAAITGLMALLTFSPCEAFLPVFLTGAKYGWLGFALLSTVLAVATVAGMITFTWLTLLGLERLRFKILENYEPMIVGSIFCLLGMLVIVLER